MPAPEDAKVANLTATVESFEDGRARIRLSGTLEAIKMIKGIDSNSSYRGTATAQGLAVYDVNHRTMSSLLLVLHGTYQQGEQPEKGHGIPLGAVIEWQLRQPSPR
jgi:hypothetical protein